ncbi:unnamed protein product, partial [Didymodactylos carnosus]
MAPKPRGHKQRQFPFTRQCILCSESSGTGKDYRTINDDARAEKFREEMESLLPNLKNRLSLIGANYHHNCYRKFTYRRIKASGLMQLLIDQSGRPTDDDGDNSDNDHYADALNITDFEYQSEEPVYTTDPVQYAFASTSTIITSSSQGRARVNKMPQTSSLPSEIEFMSSGHTDV